MNISWGQSTKRRPSHAMRIFPIAFSFITELRQDWRRIYTSRINQWGTEGEREGEGEHEESERKRKSEWWREKVWLGNEEGLDVRACVCVCWGGWCFLYLLHQFQLNFTGALVNDLEVQQETEEYLEWMKRAFMECDTLLANTKYGRPRVQHHTLSAQD